MCNSKQNMKISTQSIVTIKSFRLAFIVIGLTALSLGYLTFLEDSSSSRKVLAISTECPTELTPQQCLDFLQKQAEDISKDVDAIKSKLSSEAVSQLNLNDKINYYNGQIAGTQSNIDQLQIEIEKNNVETKILTDEIAIIEDNIFTASQEVNKLESSIQKRIGISYKYSSLSALELLLSSHEFDSLNKRIQYLKQTRDHDKEMLEGMEEHIMTLNVEKEVLAGKKLEVQNIQKDNELKKTELFAVRVELDGIKAQQQVLLAESKKLQAEYQSNIASLQKMTSDINAQVSKLILQLYQSGQIPVNTPVKAGDILGFQGHTGFAYGSHLHFEINGGYTNPFTSGYLTGGGLYQPVRSGTAHYPLDSGILTQGPHGFGGLNGGKAIDLRSTAGIQGEYYWLNNKQVCCLGICVPQGYYSMNGEGAAVRAIKDGMVSRVNTDMCGGKYVLVKHSDNETSLYLHLR